MVVDAMIENALTLAPDAPKALLHYYRKAQARVVLSAGVNYLHVQVPLEVNYFSCNLAVTPGLAAWFKKLDHCLGSLSKSATAYAPVQIRCVPTDEVWDFDLSKAAPKPDITFEKGQVVKMQIQGKVFNRTWGAAIVFNSLSCANGLQS
jgi:hypothetical protein